MLVSELDHLSGELTFPAPIPTNIGHQGEQGRETFRAKLGIIRRKRFDIWRVCAGGVMCRKKKMASVSKIKEVWICVDDGSNRNFFYLSNLGKVADFSISENDVIIENSN